MRPVDPRLARYSRSGRRFVALAVANGVVISALVIAQAFALTDIVVPVFTEGADLADVQSAVVVLGAAVAGRVLVAYLAEAAAFRAAAKAKGELRAAALDQIAALGPVWLSGRSVGELTALLTRGVDGLDAYFARYLPQLALAVAVPVMAGAVILSQDALAAVIVLVTLPLIPLFMVLVGMYTRRNVDRQWRALGMLSGHFADVVAGMATLKAFGRERAQADNVRAVGDRYRRATVGVLRISFLSSLVLEVLAMLSVAMVAVSIGLRLVDGSMTLRAGLLVLILVPEVYLPLRQVGSHYHAAAEGLGAARAVFDILDEAPPASGPVTAVPDVRRSVIAFEDVGCRYPDRSDPALSGATFEIEPLRVTALTGESGSGKTTVLAILERFIDPSAGSVRIRCEPGVPGGWDVALPELDTAAWRAVVGYVGQAPTLVAGTIADNVRLAAPQATDEQVRAALDEVALTDMVADLPDGVATRVGEGGRALSVGQARRVALARVFCAQTPLVLLDEPTASLDGPSEDAVIAAIRRLGRTRTVVMAAHRPALVEAADAVVDLGRARAPGGPPAPASLADGPWP